MSWFTDTIKSFFQEQSESIWKGFLGPAHDVIDYIGDWLKTWWIKVEEDQWAAMIAMFREQGWIDGQTEDELYKLRNMSPPLDIVGYFTVMGILTFNAVSQASYAMGADARHNANETYRPELPYPQEIINAAFVAPEKTQQIREIMARIGYKDEDIDLFFLAMYRLYPEDTIRTLYLRGEIDENTLFERLREHGYTDTRIKEMTKTWEMLPPVTDLVSFASRGLFTPETRAKWPWMFESPQGFVDWGKKQGLSRDWVDMYWANHWVQPGLRETFEMLHRKAIPVDDVIFALEARGFSQYWQEKLLKISYNPYTRVDVRRMHDLGVLTDTQLQDAYEDLGYDPERAEAMVRFTLKYNRETGRELTRSQIVNAYQTHLIGKDDARALLVDIDYSEAEADFLVEFYDYQKQKDYEDRAIANIGDRYKNNLLDSYQARERLNKLALEGQRIEILMDEWDIDKFEDKKLPSKADLDKFYKNNIIEEEDYRLEMKKLGYPVRYIDWYMELSKLKKPK